MDEQPTLIFRSARAYWRSVLPVSLALAAAGVAALLVDVPLARWVLEGNCPYFCKKICNLAEVFGHGLGVPLVVLAVVVLDTRHRRSAPRLLAASLGSGLLANGLKLLVTRWRPKDFDFEGNVLASFGQWLPLWHASSNEQSFPSTHTVTAVGLAVALSRLYPRGRWYFAALALLVAGQRVLGGYHFLSDTLWGAAVGYLLAQACCGSTRLAAWLSRFESGGRTRTLPLVVERRGHSSRAA